MNGVVVHQSNKLDKNSLNPKWQSEKIDLRHLCRGHVDYPLLLSVYHHKSNGRHVLFGEVQTSVNGLKFSHESAIGMKIKSKDGDVTGSINVHLASIVGGQSSFYNKKGVQFHPQISSTIPL